MMISTNRVDKMLGVHLQKIYKSSAASPARSAMGDIAMISRFAAMVERARSQALALPDVRPDAVVRARASLESGAAPSAGDIASSMINRAAKGEV